MSRPAEESEAIVFRGEWRVSVRAVTQLNSKPTLGIGERQFLRYVREFERAGGKVRRLGKLRCCDVDAFLAWLDVRGASAASLPEDGVAELAAELGLCPSTDRRGPKPPHKT